MDNQRVYTMKFSGVYPLYIAKVERKGHTKAEVDQVICWLTGHSPASLSDAIERQVDFQTFFAEAPAMNPLRSLITGKICGVQIEAIEDPLMREVRYLDKLVDEVANGRAMEKILRKG